MKRVVALSAIGGCAAAGFLLSRPAGEGGMQIPSSTPAPSTQSTSPNMGFIETRTHRIEMKTNGRYTIRTKSGEVLAKDVTLEGLRASNPGLHRILERAFASPDRNNDARGNLPGSKTPMMRPGNLGSSDY